MDDVGTALEISLNWNPSYSYSSLPDGYGSNAIPPHWICPELWLNGQESKL
jgi:hypothetical protein